MKKLLFALPVVLLLAAGCNSSQPVAEKNQQTNTPAPTQTQQTTPAETAIQNTKTIKIADKGNLYSVEIPQDWKVTESIGARGVSLSSTHIESPDWKSRSVAGGPSDIIYYENGAYLAIAVDTLNEDPSTNSGVDSKKNIMIGGANGVYYIFGEPSLAEGKLLGAYVSYKGSGYTFRFGYNPKTYTTGEAVFTNILNSFKFNSPVTQKIEVKGWLEGTVGNWTVAETTSKLSGYSGNKFHLQILNQSQCSVIIDSNTTNTFPCNSKNPPSKWGYGDRVRVYGTINDDGSLGVSKMEIVSALPVEVW